jgi:CubicO group peptidase (beta-lactamase class C family)
MRLAFAFLCSTLLLTACSTPGSSRDALARLDVRVEAELARAGLPGAVLAVRSRDGTHAMRAYGLADVATGEPMRPDTPMRIASVSKPVTAVAVMRLAQQGRVQLDAPVLPLLLPQLPAGTSPHPDLERLSVRQLLAHCGGWDRSGGFDPMLQSRAMAARVGSIGPPSPSQIVAWALSTPPDFSPGSRCEYSNLGYAVLGRLIEAVTGETYAAAVQRLVLRPAGIEGMRLAATRPEQRLPDEPRYHDVRHAPSAFPPHAPAALADGPVALESMDAHGGWLARAEDLVTLIAAIEGWDGEPLLKPDTRRRMLAPVWPSDAEDAFFALGWEVDRRGRYWHSGDLPGSAALLVREPDGSAWALLANGSLSDARQHDRLRRRIGAAVRRLP